MDQDALERKLYVVRKRAEATSRRVRIARRRDFFYIPSLSSRTIVYKGLLLAPQIPNFYKELLESRSHQRALPGAPALLHQHVSELAAGASLSLHLPQRRNQHAARQRELDARAPVRAGLSAVRRRHQEAPAHHHAGRQRFGHARQRRRAAHAGRPQPAARDVHADSRGLGARLHHARRRQGVSTNITPR